MKLILGLGNVGPKYDKTRHNLGFMVVDVLIEEHACSDLKTFPKFNAMISECAYNGEKIIVVKPTTFVNKSGEALKAVMNYYKVNKEDILVIYDDKDMEFGKIRFRDTGSSGGHNGIKSVIEALGSEEFMRIKVGIADPKHPAFEEASDFVLSKFSKNELEQIKGEVIPMVFDKMLEVLF